MFRRVVILFFMTLSFLMVFTDALLAINISSCANITSPGVYSLAANLTVVQNQTCVSIFSSNVTLICNGTKMINTNATGIAILIGNETTLSLNNISIENCHIENWSVGILIRNAHDISLFQNNITNTLLSLVIENTSNVNAQSLDFVLANRSSILRIVGNVSNFTLFDIRTKYFNSTYIPSSGINLTISVVDVQDAVIGSVESHTPLMFQIVNSSRVTFNHIYLNEPYELSYSFRECVNLTMRDVDVANSDDGFKIVNSSKINLTDVTVLHSSLQFSNIINGTIGVVSCCNISTCMKLEDVSNVVINNTRMENFGIAFKVINSSFLFIDNVILFNGSKGFEFFSVKKSNISHVSYFNVASPLTLNMSNSSRIRVFIPYLSMDPEEFSIYNVPEVIKNPINTSAIVMENSHFNILDRVVFLLPRWKHTVELVDSSYNVIHSSTFGFTTEQDVVLLNSSNNIFFNNIFVKTSNLDYISVEGLSTDNYFNISTNINLTALGIDRNLVWVNPWINGSSIGNIWVEVKNVTSVNMSEKGVTLPFYFDTIGVEGYSTACKDENLNFVCDEPFDPITGITTTFCEDGVDCAPISIELPFTSTLVGHTFDPYLNFVGSTTLAIDGFEKYLPVYLFTSFTQPRRYILTEDINLTGRTPIRIGILDDFIPSSSNRTIILDCNQHRIFTTNYNTYLRAIELHISQSTPNEIANYLNSTNHRINLTVKNCEFENISGIALYLTGYYPPGSEIYMPTISRELRKRMVFSSQNIFCNDSIVCIDIFGILPFWQGYLFRNIMVENVTVQYNQNSYTYSPRGILLNGVENLTVRKVNVRGGWVGIYTGLVSNTTLQNLAFINATVLTPESFPSEDILPSQSALWLVNTTNTVIKNVNMENYGSIFIQNSSFNEFNNISIKLKKYVSSKYLNDTYSEICMDNESCYGVVLIHSGYNQIENVSISGGYHAGIAIFQVIPVPPSPPPPPNSYNVITDSIITDSMCGVLLLEEDYALIAHNYIYNNTIGVCINSSYPNTIYDNYFNNTINIDIASNVSQHLNTELTESSNIMGGPYLGGNFWAYPNGTGFSETCKDVNKDGICDEHYVITNLSIDFYPLTYPPIIPKTVQHSSSSWTMPHICDEGQKRCYGDVLQMCRSNIWIDYLICDFGCDPEKLECNPPPAPPKICEDGQKRCRGIALQECRNNEWLTIEICNFGCNETTLSCNPAPPLEVKTREVPKPYILLMFVTALLFLIMLISISAV